MNLFSRISAFFMRNARMGTILPALALLVLVLAVMETRPLGKPALLEASGGQGMLDMEFGYGADTAYGLFERLGEAGRGVYARLLGVDFAFAAVFAVLQALMLSSLLRRANAPEALHRLNLLPFLRSALDVAENLALIALMGSFPERTEIGAAAAGLLTSAKWIVYYAVLASLLVLGTASAIQKKTTRAKTLKAA